MVSKGDIFKLGNHRIMCGDSTNENDVKKLLDGAEPTILLTDPPYCSGGFTESGKANGSLVKKAKITNDQLSSRGYQSLIKNMLHNSPTLYNFIFTDWRMWVYLFDVAEGAGCSVRSMIVWNKVAIGLGLGFRTQHELIMYSRKTTYKFDHRKAIANVINSKRTGNKLHPTQKPLDLLLKILSVFEVDDVSVYDPFSGSGTTLMACDEIGRPSWNMEIDPRHVSTIIKRYEEVHGEGSAVKLCFNSEGS